LRPGRNLPPRREVLPALPFLPPSNDQAAQAKAEPQPLGDIQQQTMYVEVVAFVWERMMYGLSVLLALVGVGSLLTRMARPLHLVAAGAIALSTVGTVVGMALLASNTKGGFNRIEPLAIRWYVYVAIAQAFYGFVLLTAFARKPAAAV